ncbi:MAG: phosphoribosylformylglycinamidine synthase subunit PurQ [Fimbriimonadales bacterium]|nr:MAG: phosphoribosylformylglycinamidine synthase subunit PurQ [Fimbriimonadales bacterium]
MKAAVVVFPGSNCDRDAYHALCDVLGYETEYLWHASPRPLSNYGLVIVPGGFSYGDYLRPGAIARFARIMDNLREYAEHGGLVLGVCNGFQILCELGLLPGALTRNLSLKFRCKPVHIRVENADTPFTRRYQQGEVLQIPIAHGDGRYVCDETTLQQLRTGGQIIFRYCSPTGELGDAWNPNGSVDHIAGVANEQFNILGMMPHPERACELLLGSADGRRLLAVG